MKNTTNRQASVDSRRVSLEREIAIRVPRFDTFVTEYSQNISTTGMFIVSDKPQPPGTTFSFEFSVADDWKLIRGKAQVVWTRYRNEGPERPSGMGVRFLEVDAQSRRLVRWIVEKHIREGGKPFELDELRSVIDQALEEVLDTDETPLSKVRAADPAASRATRPKPSASVRSAAATTLTKRSDRRAWPLLLTAAAVLLTVGLLFWLTELLPGQRRQNAAVSPQGTDTGEQANRGDQSIQAAVSEPADSEAAAVSASSSEASGNVLVSDDAVSRPDVPAPPIGSSYKSVLDSVTAWADAWSDRDTARYLSSYARSFTPAGGMSRRQWEAQRRERLARPSHIKVSISSFDLDRLDETRVRVTFTQSYRSDRFSDLVNKTMELIWEDGYWKIASETAL